MKIWVPLVVGAVLGGVLTGLAIKELGKITSGGAKKMSYAGVEYAPSTDKVFENQIGPNLSYKVTYPRDFDLTSLDGASGSGFLNKFPVKISLPDDAFAGDHTNYSEAWLTLDYDNAKSEMNCFASADGSGQQMTELKTIGANTFHVGHPGGGAAAGNLYTSTVYRLMINGGCAEAVTTLHTTNVANYDPGTVKEFDATKTEKMLGGVLSTLTFTQK